MFEQTQSDDIQTGEMISILLVDDHPFVRQALKILIERQPDMKVIAEANNGAEAITLAEKLLPDTIIMDIGMPVLDGLEATRQIKARFPNIAILVLTVHTDQEHIRGILKAGAAGYLTKIADGGDIVKSIRTVMAGEAVLAPQILQQILDSPDDDLQKNVPSVTNLELTAREIVILKLAAKGLSNKNISTVLNLSENTIKSYVKAIFTKIHVSSRTEAVIIGLKAGFINLNDLS